MTTMTPRHFTLLLAAALTLLTSLTASAAVTATEQAKPRNRLMTKLKPQPPVAPPVEDDTVLSEEQLAVAPRVHQGHAQCEFNQSVEITPHPDKPGRFRLQFGKLVYNMAPEPTSTGAVRLEDKRAGIVWLQIPTKSMLMNAKAGQRMVDACQHPAQQNYASDAAKAANAGQGIGITPGTSISN